jgi:hypothetical protein
MAAVCAGIVIIMHHRHSALANVSASAEVAIATFVRRRFCSKRTVDTP